MIKQGKGGRIVGASSVAGKQGDWAYFTLQVKYCLTSLIYAGWKNVGGYSASKFAVRGLTQSAGPYYSGWGDHGES